jgi:hypothetical protein
MPHNVRAMQDIMVSSRIMVKCWVAKKDGSLIAKGSLQFIFISLASAIFLTSFTKRRSPIPATMYHLLS